MDNRKLANYLLSEGMESIEENVVLDFVTNAGLALTIGAITWNRLKNADEPTVGEMIINRIAELKKDKELDGKNPMARVRIKLSRAITKYDVFIHDVFEDLTTGKSTPEKVAEGLAAKIKFDDEERRDLLTYLKAVAHKLISSQAKLTDS